MKNVIFKRCSHWVFAPASSNLLRRFFRLDTVQDIRTLEGMLSFALLNRFPEESFLWTPESSNHCVRFSMKSFHWRLYENQWKLIGSYPEPCTIKTSWRKSYLVRACLTDGGFIRLLDSLWDCRYFSQKLRQWSWALVPSWNCWKVSTSLCFR